jgi:hypothetical protein
MKLAVSTTISVLLIQITVNALPVLAFKAEMSLRAIVIISKTINLKEGYRSPL